MVCQNGGGKADAEEDRVGVGLVGVTVGIPGGKDLSELIHDLPVFRGKYVAQIFGLSLGGEPVAADGNRGIFGYLGHLFRRGVGDNVEGTVGIP